MAVYGGIQAHELSYWLDALTHAAYDPRRPLANVHGGRSRACTARQDLLDIAGSYRTQRQSAESAAADLSCWCLRYLDEAEWYRLTGEPVEAADKPDSHDGGSHQSTARALDDAPRHRVG